MSKRIIIPANFSYSDPLPFECDTGSTSLPLSLSLYGVQASYLILGAILNFLIVRTICFKTKKSTYRSNSFYMLYTADAVVGIYINISELLVGRLFIYVTPLCPIVSPYFFGPSIFFKLYYTLVHYCSGFKTVSQIFLSLNRMTCVIFPMRHLKIWRKMLKPSLIILFILPLGIIWNIVISRVYINPNGAGFSANYKDTVQWANVSLLHLIYCLISFFLVIIFFIATIVGLVMLEKRVKGTERSLTLATMIMAVQMMIFAFIQIYFAFFAASTPSLRGLLLLCVMLIYDMMNVTSPVALLLMSSQLKNDVFGIKSGANSSSHVAASSRSISTASRAPQQQQQQGVAFRSISTVSMS